MFFNPQLLIIPHVALYRPHRSVFYAFPYDFRRNRLYVERAFKQMKNPHWVSFSPAFHWTDQKLRVHAFYCVLALLLSSVLQRKAAHGGLKLTIEKLLAELSGVTELVNLFAAPEKGTRGRYRAEYVLSERSPLQDKLCRMLDVYKNAHR